MPRPIAYDYLGYSGVEDPGLLSALQFAVTPPQFVRNAMEAPFNALGWEPGGSFRESVMRPPQATLGDLALDRAGIRELPMTDDTPGTGGMAQRAFDRLNLNTTPGQARSANPLRTWASSDERSAGGAVAEAMWPNLYRTMMGAASGNFPGPADIGMSLFDLAPGPTEFKAAMKLGAPAVKLGSAVTKALGVHAAADAAGAVAAKAAGPLVSAATSPAAQAILAGSKAAAPFAALPAAAALARRELRAQAKERAARGFRNYGTETASRIMGEGQPPLVRFGNQRGAFTPFASTDDAPRGMGIGGSRAGTVEPVNVPEFEGRQRMNYPGVFGSPEALTEAANVAPESPNLSRLFDTTRQELSEIALNRRGNLENWIPPATPARPRGSAAAQAIMTDENAARLAATADAARARPELFHGGTGWYSMDPLYSRMESLIGADAAPERFRMLNAMTGVLSPGSDVLTEINRGTRADWLNTQGRIGDFYRFGGNPGRSVLQDLPETHGMRGHPYHSTSQAKPLRSYLETGSLGQAAKVPSYVNASGVPQTGFQTSYPVGDAHWARGVGLADVRTNQGYAQSATLPEMTTLAPWYRGIAEDVGMDAVPLQALHWNLFSPQTGVKSPVGAPKLELIADSIAQTAAKRGMQPEEARDLFLRGLLPVGEMVGNQGGRIDPSLLWGMGIGGGVLGGGLLGAELLRDRKKRDEDEIDGLVRG